MNESNLRVALTPLLLVSIGFAFVAYFLAKDKRRNVGLWTVLGAIPMLNMLCMLYFSGATNLRLEQKIDKLGGS